MAYVTGTATGVKDLFEKIRTQLKSNTDLSAASPAQTWQELFYIEDNIDEMNTSMTMSSGVVEDIACNVLVNAVFTNIVLNSSFIRMKFRTAKPVTRLLLTKPNNTSNYMPNSIRLEYSDNDINWTTAATINTSTPAWTVMETREYSGWAATGSHLYWRIVPVTLQNASNWHFGGLALYNGAECVNSVRGETMLKGPGLAGTDEIFIGMIGQRSVSNQDYRLRLYGYTGFNPEERSVAGNHPGSSVIAYPWTTLWDQPMSYWLTISGRRIIASIKVSTVYEGFYLGFILPYATPTQYPYPLAVGGSQAGNGSHLYSYQDARHSIFCMPGSSFNSTTADAARTNTSSLLIFHPTGVWQSLASKSSYTIGENPNEAYVGSKNFVHPSSKMNNQSVGGSQDSYIPYAENIGGGYTLHPHVLVAALDTPGAVLGELDGTKQISGVNNSTENTGTISGTDYIIFQNTYRTTDKNYWAMQKG